MDKEKRNKIIVGAFVSIGMALFIIGVYFVGAKKNMFTSTFTIVAVFNDVDGLQSGDNVRFKGIDVGTIKSINITSDSMVVVDLSIENKMQQYIKNNACVSIGTDGLMGNKLATIRNGDTMSKRVVEGDTLLAINPVASEDVIHSLNNTAKNASVVVDNLKAITGKINNSNGLWTLLHDSSLDGNLRQAMVSIKLTGNRSATVMGDLSQIIKHINEGKGSVGALLTDTSLENSIKQSVVNIHVLSDKMAIVSGDLTNINKGEGALGTLIMDTAFAHNLNESMQNIKTGSQGLSDDMEALKHSFLLRKYFKKQAKAIKQKSK